MKKENRICPLQLVAADRTELVTGIVLIGASFLMPLLFNVHNFGIRASIMRALRYVEKIDLIAAAVELVALNFRWRGRRAWPLNSLMILIILLLTYQGIGFVHDIHYDFGIPAVLVCFFVFFFRKIHYRYLSLQKKASMIALVLIACQFLDIMPLVDKFPVGRGETSREIKLTSTILGADTVLNTVAIVGILLFLTFALVIFFQLRSENNLKELSFLREQNQAILMQSQLNEMKNRTHQEMQYLVHDLKSPLTAVQTLVGVLKMECEAEKRSRDVEYLDHIETAVERMSEMISEILYQDQCAMHATEELVGIALAQSSVNDYAAYLRVDNQVPQALVSANRFLFPRALINLLENSAQAMDSQSAPEIWLRVSRGDGGSIVFAVQDNGTGIEKEQLEEIWNRGNSGRQSSGLGLAFVRNVVEQMHGQIHINSEPQQGTSIFLILPEESTAGN